MDLALPASEVGSLRLVALPFRPGRCGVPEGWRASARKEYDPPVSEELVSPPALNRFRRGGKSPQVLRIVALGLVVLLIGTPSIRAESINYVYDTQNKLTEVRHGDSVLARFQWDREGRLIRKIGQLG